MKDKLSTILTGFQKGHGAQHSSLIMTEKWKRALDENMKVGAIFMDLSKAFDTLNHRLLLAKLKVWSSTNCSKTNGKLYYRSFSKDKSQ